MTSDVQARIAALERENTALRAELRTQWEANHFEHCGRHWPHAEGDRCFWPLPSLLNDDDDPETVA